MLKIFCTGCFDLFQAFRRSSLLKCVSQHKVAKISIKLPILAVQAHSRSSMLTFLKRLLPVLVMISSMTMLICNHFYARAANSGKIAFFQGALFPLFV